MSQPVNAVLHEIHIHPVKSLTGCAQGSATVEPWGLAGDRRWMLVDETGKAVTQRQHARLALAAAQPLPCGGVRLSAPGLEPLTVTVPEPVGTIGVQLFRDKIDVIPAGPAADAWFSAYLGAAVRLVHLDDPAVRRPVNPKYARPGDTVNLADGYPLLLTTLSSLDALNSLVARGDLPEEGPLPMDRFRPTVVVSGTPPWAEDGWSRIAIGAVVLRVAKACGRCVITTIDQRTSERGREPLRTLALHRRVDNDLPFGQNLIPEGTGVLHVGDPVHILE
ncbi:MOSC domain-containing protein [Streptomyces sp. NBC_00388]|uniref:MOSC domain-containing protein n=1 Tax=Streptomyces sp. NBC_00388 TaxID=2975735 RepID=UPI002E1AAAAE